MTNASHTPGPWVVGTDTMGFEVCTVYGVPTQPTEDGKGQEYVYVHYPRIVDNDFYFPTREENLANARLIAASPELLEALEALIDEARKPAEPITGKMTTHEFMLKANAKLGVILVMHLPAIEAAIAKARGQS